MTDIRTGQAPAPLTREQFHERFQVRFYDPAFEGEREAIARLEAIAWEALQDSRKAPQSPSPLKLMIDSLVCADGGNPDPTTTHGKRVAEAKAIEEKGCDYPKHLAGRAYGVVVHGDVAGVETHRRNLTDWLESMGLIDAGAAARLDRYIGYYEPYYNSHDALDEDHAVQ